MTLKQAAALALATLVGPSGAAAQTGNIWVPAKCNLKPGHYLVNSGVLYLKKSVETRFEEERKKQLGEAQRVLVEAVSTAGQDSNPAAWYYLGRYYYVQQDPEGADTAFTHAERLKPDCRDDIDTWRRFLWVPTLNGGIQAWQAGNTDSAIVMLRRANAIYKGEPNGFIYLAILFANGDQVDSAAKYFKLGVEIAAKDTAWAKDHREASFNLARVYHRAQRWDDAIQAYRAYLGMAPNDPEATSGLANVYDAAGKKDSARALYRAVLERADPDTTALRQACLAAGGGTPVGPSRARCDSTVAAARSAADSTDPVDIFQAGVMMFQGAPEEPDTVRIGNECRARERASTPRPTPRQVTAKCNAEVASKWKEYDIAAAESYRMAARAFEAGLRKNPHYRDAIFNVTNAYFAVRDTAQMLPWARKLYALDPMNRNTIRLLAQAWHMRGRGDSAYKYLVQADSLLDIDITVSSFQYEDSSATLTGLATNVRAKATAPAKVTFEFLNVKGEPVTSQAVDFPALQVESNHQFELKATGQGIVAWRYRRE